MTGAPRILLATTQDEVDLLFSVEDQERLVCLGDLTLPADRSAPNVPVDLADAFDIVITSWGTPSFDPELVRGTRLRLAVHAAASVRALFPKSAIRGDLRLCQAGAEPMSLPVAEFSLTLTLALLRNLHTHDRGLQNSQEWHASGHGMLGHDLQSRHIGIVGLSRCGVHYARMMRGLGVDNLLAYDPYCAEATAKSLGVELVPLGELCRRSEVLAIHAPSTPQTRSMIDADALGKLPDDAIVVNTARSAVVDMKALCAELVSGRLRAGLDVFDDEPLPSDSPLFGLPNALLTPHVAGGTVEARTAQGTTVVDEIERFLSGRPLQHEVTVDSYDRLA